MPVSDTVHFGQSQVLETWNFCFGCRTYTEVRVGKSLNVVIVKLEIPCLWKISNNTSQRHRVTAVKTVTDLLQNFVRSSPIPPLFRPRR